MPKPGKVVTFKSLKPNNIFRFSVETWLEMRKTNPDTRAGDYVKITDSLYRNIHTFEAHKPLKGLKVEFLSDSIEKLHAR